MEIQLENSILVSLIFSLPLSLSFVSGILTKYSMIDNWRIFIRAGGVVGNYWSNYL